MGGLWWERLGEMGWGCVNGRGVGVLRKGGGK